jgi:CMP-N-acetylneuraminic acid synthetase
MDARQGEIVALLPMRHHSVRVPGKNLRKIGGVPLYHHIVRSLLTCPSISKIVIDTDSPAIREDVQSVFPQITVLWRPEHLRGDDVPMTEILFHDASQIPAECYLQTHSTNPFLMSGTIEGALASWRSERNIYDSLFGVTRVQARLWDGTARPLNHNPWLLLRTQELPPLYIENSTLYVFPAQLICSTHRRIGDRPKLFEVDPLEAIDIDNEQDFNFAEAVVRSRQLTGP